MRDGDFLKVISSLNGKKIIKIAFVSKINAKAHFDSVP